METDWFEQILADEPELNDFGFGHLDGHRGRSPAERDAIFQENRQRLRNSRAQVEGARAWIIRTLEPQGSINRKHTSYGLKHLAEPDIGYVTNGVFILAMLSCGYQYRRAGPNACFNIVSPMNRFRRFSTHKPPSMPVYPHPTANRHGG